MSTSNRAASTATFYLGAWTVLAAAVWHLVFIPADGNRVNDFSIRVRSFNVASPSMEPTLLPSDYLLTRPRPDPARGDVVAYRLPTDDRYQYIKRVVGLPGDRVQMIGGALHINGAEVERKRVEDFRQVDSDGKVTSVRQWQETLPGGASYRTLDHVENGNLDNTPVHTVPAGQYFVLGDNRDNSLDSRWLAKHGYVPADNMIGRAEIIYFSIAEGESGWRLWRWPQAIRWSRILMRTR